MYISFDQAIDPETVLQTTSVTAGGRKLATRLATQAEIDADGSVSYYAKQAQPGRWLAFRAVNSEGGIDNALPGASTISVSVEKGTHSAEGPLTTTAAQSFSFQTYSPLKLNAGYCGWRENKNCTPFESWYLEFNNQINATKFTKEMIKIEPALEGLNIYPSGNGVYIEGYKKGRTTYKITVDPSISDIFGQSLGSPATASIKVGSADTNLYAQGGFMTVMDPTAKPTFSIYSTNLREVKVRLYSVRPQDWHQYQDFVAHLNYDDGKRPAMPGSLAVDKVDQVAMKPDEMVETRIDLAEALDGGYGNVIVDIEPTVHNATNTTGPTILTWVQATQIGLDAFVDNTSLSVLRPSSRPANRSRMSICRSIRTESGQRNTIDHEPNPASSSGRGTGCLAGDTERQMTSSRSIPMAPSRRSNRCPRPSRTKRATTAFFGCRCPMLPPDNQQNMLIAKRGKDTAFLPENTEYYWQTSGTWYKKEPDPTPSAGSSLTTARCTSRRKKSRSRAISAK